MRGLRIALLVLLAGCAGGTNEAAPASTVAPSTTTTITPTTTSTTAPAGSTTITPTTTVTTVTTTASASTAAPTVPELLDFTATLSDGSTFVGADLAGTDVLFWFWAPN
ncbi:MAG: hypothetical protein CL459_02775 [Acidimicrobiaceae bacterium]|nr:hypothetical protein [Acidimicrobiaceae bacterium]|tara:strand:- start:8001 stop:8327 length:327 start_codon:yes stop_codon:yes gene_type:complete